MTKSNQNKSNLNINRIREIVRNTEDNLQEAEVSMEFADSLEKSEIQQKNKRRKETINELKEEIKEELHDRKK